MSIYAVFKEGFYQFPCIHCRGWIFVAPQDVACQVFRHGILKTTGQPINPHASQTECEQFVANDTIWGCGKPFFMEPIPVPLDWPSHLPIIYRIIDKGYI